MQVWKAHRRVCGPGKANPFTWPLLSRDEADELVKHMHESTGMLKDGQLGCSTVAEAIEQVFTLPSEKVPVRRPLLASWTCQIVPKLT